MRFFNALLAGAAMVSTAVALTFESVPSSVTIGVPVTITYSGNGGYLVTINLLHGNDAASLMIIAVLTTASSSGSFIWTPPSTLVDGPTYAFSIVQYDVTNYSGLFSVTGAGATVSPSATASVSATSGSIPVPTNGSITAVPYSNTTIPYASAATGSSMARNTTMSMATLTALSTAAGSITGGPRGGDPTETGASSPPVVVSTGGANILAKSLALIVGSFAVVVYLI